MQRLNPLLITTQAERDISSLIYDGLVKINEFGEPIPDLAQSWVVSRDGYDGLIGNAIRLLPSASTSRLIF